MYYRIIPRSDELIHYGVKGMHWGVRRYQDYNGHRIGTGGSPVTRPSKSLKNTIVGGQGGKAVGTKRLAARAGGNRQPEASSSNNEKKGKGWLDPTIKQGKGRENTSPAQEVAKGIRDASRESKSLVDIAEKHDKSLNASQKKQAEKAKKMSDKELRDSINRIKMEREYVSLTSKETKTGYDKTREVLDIVGDVASIALTLIGIAVAVKKLKHDGLEDGETFDVLYSELKHSLNESNFEEEFIQHALDLDEEYIDDYLEHHGIKGMKWGVRRYQNYDGTRIGGGGGGGIASGNFRTTAKQKPGEKKIAENYRNSIAGGQGGKAVGTERLAAKAGGLFKKDPSRDMQRDIEGVDFDSKVKRAQDAHVKKQGLILPDGARSVSTGKNYDKALDDASADWQSSDTQANWKEAYDKLEKDTDAFLDKYYKGTATQKELDDLLDRGRKLDAAYTKEGKQFIDKHADDLNAAVLRDLGYDEEHVAAGVEYCKKKNKQLFEYII